MAGTRTKLNEETLQKLEQAIGAGATYRLACAYAGITDDTLLLWRKKRSDVSERIARAEANAGLRWLARIEQASQIDWKAAAWKLEHRYPDEYGRSVQQVQGPDGGPLAVELSEAPARERLRAKVTELAARRAMPLAALPVAQADALGDDGAPVDAGDVVDAEAVTVPDGGA